MDDPASSFLLLFQQTAAPVELSFTRGAVEIALMLLIVIVNGFFVASEFSLVSARKTRLEARAAEGSKGAAAALRLLSNPTLFISAVQLGVTLSSLALGWVGEPTIAQIIEPLAEKIASEGTVGYVVHITAIVISFAIVTFLHIVLGELFPKMFALEKAEIFATFASRPLEVFAKIFSPLLYVFNKAGGALGRLAGLNASLDESAVYTEEEIRQLVKLSQESGHLNAEEQRLINQVFEFSDTTVREAMIPRPEVVAIPASATLVEIAKMFREHGYSRMPVFGDSLDDIRGVLHSKDVMQYLLLKPRMFKLERVLKKPYYVVDTARLEDVLRQMQREKFHFGFVVDEHGGVEGIITLEDLLEEIVGDISDEHDEEVNEQIKELEDGCFDLDGGLAVRDLNKRCGLNIPLSESYTTIAGFLMAEAGRILTEGETVPFNGHVFRIEKVERRRVLKVKMMTAEVAAVE